MRSSPTIATDVIDSGTIQVRCVDHASVKLQSLDGATLVCGDAFKGAGNSVVHYSPQETQLWYSET